VGAWVLLFIAVGYALVGCGGRASRSGAAGGTVGSEMSGGRAGAQGPSSGGSAGNTENGGAAGESGGGADENGGAPDDGPPPPVDPEVSRAWAWHPCGQLQPAAADRAALFDASGRIVVLGATTVRVHAATGERVDAAEMVPADFLLAAPGGQVLSGRFTATGIALTSIGEGAPSIVLPTPPVACGSQFSMSPDGAYVLAADPGLGCAWRVSDSSYLGRIEADQVSIRNEGFVSVERTGPSNNIVLRDFAGRELSRRELGEGSITLSPAGDRAVVGSDLIDLDTGDVIAWDVPPASGSSEPLFSPRGEMVLIGDGVFSAADGVRHFRLDPEGRLARRGGDWTALSADGSRAVSSGVGRATVLDAEAKGVRAVLGPPPPLDPTRGNQGTSDLAISRDGSLLLHNLRGFAAFGIRVAPSFSDSQVLWDVRVEINLSVEVSTDGRLAAVGGDGRAIYDARDGQVVWDASPPPPEVPEQICLLDRLRFSPKATWLAGSDYSRKLQIFPVNGAKPWEPLLELPANCDAPAFSRDERLMATSAAALYRTGAASIDWEQVWSSPFPVPDSPNFDYGPKDVQFSPDSTQLLVSRCNDLNGPCTTTLLSVATGAISRQVPELTGPHPSFSPEGSWIVAANQLLHLPSGEVRSLGAEADPSSPSIFTPSGDIIAGSASGALTLYCRDR
jgi:hypothetical protein